MKVLTEQEKMAITTTINLAFEICENTPNREECPSCPFWKYCEHSDESIGYYLDNLFKPLLENT